MMIRSTDEDLPAGSGVQRAFDLAVTVPALIVLAPLIALIAFAIWVETGGPVLYRQVRLGRGGRPFVMLKFRKFAPDAPAGCALTRHCDSRMTVLGGVLMATKLDELPQLWNVIKGDMAIVGPRPESLAFADCYKDGFERVLDYTPGILGPCQILFRNESALFPAEDDPERFYREVLFGMKVRIDLAYFERRTLLGDVGLLLRGVAAVVISSAPQLPSMSGQPMLEAGSVALAAGPGPHGLGETLKPRAPNALSGRKGFVSARSASSALLRKGGGVQTAQRS